MDAVASAFAMLLCDVVVTRASAIGAGVLEENWQQDPPGS